MDDKSYANAVYNLYYDCVKELEQNKAQFVKNPKTDFTRLRKISFSDCVHFGVMAGNGALQNELLRQFSFSETTPTKSAFCQQRGKILPEAFEYLLRNFTSQIHTLDAPKTYKGYEILASDGTSVNIPYNPNDKDTFHQNGDKKGYNQIHLNALYQMLDGYYRDCVLASEGKTHERAALNLMIDRFPNSEKAIFLMDRGFESYNVLAHLLHSGQKFVLRIKDINSNGILSTWFLPEKGEFDTEIETTLTRLQTKEICSDRERFTVLPSTVTFDYLDELNPFFYMKLRIVRMEIAPGVFECVATNLDPDEFPLQEIKKLYHMRWGEETSFRDLKYTIDLVHFHAKKHEYVEQEIYASIVRFNFCGAITHHIDIPEPKNNDRKYDYKVCFAAAVTVCLEYLRRGPDSLNPVALIIRFLSPVRPDRSFRRNVRPQSAKSFFYRAS